MLNGFCANSKCYGLNSSSLLLALAVIALSTCRVQAQTQLITNGGFESGSLTGWTVANSLTQGGDYDGSNTPSTENFYDQGNSGVSPASGVSVLSPDTGSNFAVSDMTGPGESALIQSFTVPSGAKSVILTFDMYVYDYAGAGGAIDPSGLDWTTAGSDPTQPNQQARVDLLSSSSSAFSTTTGDLENFYDGVDPEAAEGEAPVWRSYTYDITSEVIPGDTYQLRFAEVNNEFVLNQGVDNVSIVATGSASAPEPTTIAFLLLSGGVFFIPRRRRI